MFFVHKKVIFNNLYHGMETYHNSPIKCKRASNFEHIVKKKRIQMERRKLFLLKFNLNITTLYTLEL